MSELLVRVVDKINEDPLLNSKCTKRGDVIVVCPDGWEWSVEERSNPNWRIIKMPDMNMDEASRLLAPELDTDPNQPSRVLQRRAFKINFILFPLRIRLSTDSSVRRDETLEVKVINTADAIMVEKTRLVERDIIGDDPRVFG